MFKMLEGTIYWTHAMFKNKIDIKKNHNTIN
jgi:hypothetical protein